MQNIFYFEHIEKFIQLNNYMKRAQHWKKPLKNQRAKHMAHSKHSSPNRGPLPQARVEVGQGLREL